MPEAKKIRVGLLCTGATLPHWQARVVRHLQEVPGAELVVIGSSQHDHFFLGRSKGAFYERIYKRCLAMLTTTSSVHVDLTEQFGEVPRVELVRTSTEQVDISALGSYSPDVVISLLPTEDQLIPWGTIPVWNFSFDGAGLMPNAAPNLLPKFLREGTVQAELSALGKGMVTAQFPLRTEQGEPTLDLVLLGASWLPAVVVAAMASGRSDLVQIEALEPSEGTEGKLSILSMIWILTDLRFRQYGRKKELKPMVPEWNIGILYQPITALLDEDPSMNVRWLPSPSQGNKRLEPFGYTAPDGQLNVLYRKNQRNSELDEIARLRPKSDSVLKRSRTMLTAAATLEYPFVVERDNGIFVLISYPLQDRTELFRVVETNDKLDHVRTLLKKALINPTSIYFEGLWWLFGTDPDAPDTVLLAYYANEFEGPYQAHELNPLKFSDKSTRSGGTPFMHMGDLWRPTRDASTPGTDHVTLNRITTLTTKEFKEEVGKRIEGFPGTAYAKGIRTLCAMGDITLIDGLRGTGVEKHTGKGNGSSRSGSKRKRKKE